MYDFINWDFLEASHSVISKDWWIVMEGIQGNEALFGLKWDLGNEGGFYWS